MHREFTKDQIFMHVAYSIARLGTCDRKMVGAVIIRDGRCVSWGYNGAPPGMPHCDENNHGWGQPPGLEGFEKESREIKVERHGCRNATHAEANALAFAARQGISTDGSTLYVTVSPCETCSRLIIAAGIREVIWDEEYRDRAGGELLRSAGLVP